ncbi:MAG TPA: LysM peptidoglycan-binding domain-containing protein [Flavisolibacter sp.]|jgi:LysM repeat protein
MKKSILLLLIFFSALSAFSQGDLLVKSNEKGLYIQHTVAPKETFYSIGRLYNISPKEIAPFNGISMDNGLTIGQTIMIPLTAANFTQSSQKGTPVYYVVGEGEGLYRVSTKNAKVLMADLRKWNNLSSDNITPGQKLIVGYVAADAAAIVAAPQPTRKEEVVTQTAKPVEPPPAPVQKKPEAEKQQVATVTPKKAAVTDSKGGYFRTAFDQQSRTASAQKEQTATAGIFKTASGWQDAKYYALMDGVEPGTIVRVVNPTNSKAVYAKVLGAMSGISQNKGLDVRISNAAANVLDVSDTEKFVVKVDY